MAGRVNGFSLAYTALGAVVLWSGFKGETISDTFRSLLQGQAPAGGEEPIIGSMASSAGTAAAGTPGTTDSAIANTALRYTGSRYVWGGIPGTTIGVDDGTDCSGFVNLVLGRDLALPIPGYAAGKYNGSTHGPVTGQYLLWNGAENVPLSQAQPGDLACWFSHIGIFVDNGQHVVSSLDAQSGVVVTSLEGATPSRETLHVRRVTVTVGANAGGGGRVLAQ